MVKALNLPPPDCVLTMLLEIFGFITMSFTDVLDILLVALVIFFVFKWMRQTAAVNIILAIVLIYLTMVIVDALNMKLMSRLVGIFVDVGVLGLIIIFQPELRHFLMKFGATAGEGKKWRSLMNKIIGYKEGNLEASAMNEITEACRTMSEQKIGALIVLPHKMVLEYIIQTGDKIDALVSRRLLLNLFFKNSPLHDGAVVIKGDRVVAARCTLPITERQDLPASFGMRHKAAIGLTEETDADVIVVSEETGLISFVREGRLTKISNINELKLLLRTTFSGDDGESKK